MIFSAGSGPPSESRSLKAAALCAVKAAISADLPLANGFTEPAFVYRTDEKIRPMDAVAGRISNFRGNSLYRAYDVN